jgi:hypothetical protein
MRLAAMAPSIIAADVEDVGEDRRAAEGVLVPPDRLGRDLAQARPFDRRRGAGEISLDELGAEAHSVKDLRTAVGLVGRDPHLGDDLEDALADCLDVAVDNLVLVDFLGEVLLHGL